MSVTFRRNLFGVTLRVSLARRIPNLASSFCDAILYAPASRNTSHTHHLPQNIAKRTSLLEPTRAYPSFQPPSRSRATTRCVSKLDALFGTLLASSNINNPPVTIFPPPLQNHPLCATLALMRSFLTALLILLPLACAKPDEQTRQRNIKQKKLLQVPTPERFAIGDSFTYSNPTTTWQITDIRNNRLLWQSNLGERMETSSNPFLPALLWESRRYGKGRRSIAQKKGSLFPLKQGRQTRFTANTTNTKGQIQNFTWNCIIGEKQKTIVPAGTFQTFEVLCQRKNADALIYRYAPAIARVVEFRTPGLGLARATRRQLIGYNSLAGAAFQQNQPKLLEPLSHTDEEEKKSPYRPTLPPIAPLPFAPPSDFFAPQQDSVPSTDPAKEQPTTEPLKRMLEEALEEQQNRLPILPQFQETTPGIPLSPQPQLQPLPQLQPQPLPQPLPQPQQNELPEETIPLPENTTSAVRLGDYPSLSQARQAWQRISKNRNLAKTFAGRRYDIVRQNDATRGILYALYTHPYINAEAAQEACDAVQKEFRRNACRITAWKR